MSGGSRDFSMTPPMIWAFKSTCYPLKGLLTMPLASALDYSCISAWNLSAELTQRRSQLLMVAKVAFQMLAASGRMPQPEECERVLIFHLLISSPFAALMTAGGVPDDLIIRDMLAGCIVRIVLDEDWQDIEANLFRADVTTKMGEIRAQTLREDAVREAHRAVERLNELNRNYRDPALPTEQTLPITEPAQLEGALAVLYARFVSRWNSVSRNHSQD
jgi:hypothetical protein